jgi:hypothetical protein
MINLDDFLPASDKFQYRIGTPDVQVLSGHEIRKQLRLKPLEDGYIDP